MSHSLAEKILNLLRSRLGLTVFAFIGGTGAILAALALYNAELKAASQDFERRQNLRQAFLQQSLVAYENSLFALRLVAENSHSLNPHEFERAARNVQARGTGIHSIQWAPVVSDAEIEPFLARARELVDPGFFIRQRKRDGTFVPFVPNPGGDDKEHAIITYAYPTKDNESTLGYDIFTAPTAPELQHARRTLELTLTRPLRLIQGFDGVILTCYARREDGEEGPPLTGSGYLQIVLRLREVLQSFWLLGPASVADFALYDVTEPEPVALYTHLTGHPNDEAVPTPMGAFVTPETLSRDFKVGGRMWRACYRPDPAWMASRPSTAPWLVLCGGLLLTALGVAYLRLLLRRAERIRREVAERTAELSESRALLDAVITHSPSAIWVKDIELRFRLVNREFCRLYNLAPEDVAGQGDSRLHPPEIVAEMETVDREILASGRARHFEFTAPIAGERRTYLVTKFPLRHAGGRIHSVAGIATDITERRQAEAERASIERRMQETQKLESLGVLAGGIAHDFNNLLTGILGHASLCRAQLVGSAPQQQYLYQIEQAARRAAELCQQMLAYSGRGRFAVESIELGALVRETVPLLRLSLGKQARLQFDFAPELPSLVADPSQLRQLVMNLVMNASESIGEGGGNIMIRTRLVAATVELFTSCVHTPDIPPGDYVCLEITDTGCGMPPETVARIFDPFFTTKFTGRGLGLASVLGIVRGHRGALRVDSHPGQGTTFHVYLPPSNEAPPPEPLAGDMVTATVSRPFPAACRLLLVDDEESVRETAASILRAFGYEVDTAARGDEALTRFRADPVRHQLALIDLTMPGLSGRELLTALREIRPELPVLLMSGYSEIDATSLLSAPRTAFLSKPFTVAALREKIATLLTP